MDRMCKSSSPPPIVIIVWKDYKYTYIPKKGESMQNIYNLYYVAGLFDGEGTVTLAHNSNREFRRPIVSITSTSYELIEWLHNSFNGIVCNHRKYKDHHKKSWVWHIASDNAIKFLEQISDKIQEKEKIRRVNLILNKYKSVTKRNGKYTEKEIKAKQEFENEFFANSLKVDQI